MRQIGCCTRTPPEQKRRRKRSNAARRRHRGTTNEKLESNARRDSKTTVDVSQNLNRKVDFSLRKIHLQ
jgi:hypothetical protein